MNLNSDFIHLKEGQKEIGIESAFGAASVLGRSDEVLGCNDLAPGASERCWSKSNGNQAYHLVSKLQSL